MDAPVAIIGGGISGLSTAYYLAQAGIPSTLIEARPRLGGVIQSENVEGGVIEGGPDSFLSMKPAAMELFRPLGRVARGQSVAAFVASHYGAEAVDSLAEPLLSGIYGGSPSALSITSVLPRFVELEARYGSLTKGVLAELKANKAQAKRLPLFRTLKSGLGQLVSALTASLEGHATVLHRRAEAVERTGGGFRVELDDGLLECAQVVLACEAHNAATLAGKLDGRLADLLGSIPYSSSMTVALGFPSGAFPKPL